MKRPILLAILAACMTALAAPSAWPAECCMGTVYTSVARNSKLTRKLDVIVQGDDPDHHYDATVTPYLKVGSRRIERLAAFRVRDVNPVAQHHALRISSKTVRLA